MSEAGYTRSPVNAVNELCFRENRYGDSSPLLMGTNEILLVIKEIFLSDLIKTRYRNVSEQSVN